MSPLCAIWARVRTGSVSSERPATSTIRISLVHGVKHWLSAVDVPDDLSRLVARLAREPPSIQQTVVVPSGLVLPVATSALQPSPIERVAEAYLRDVYSWAPVLSPDHDRLCAYLSTSDPLLCASIACVVDLSIAPPSFPPTYAASISTVQAAYFLSLHAYGLDDLSGAIDIVQWLNHELRRLGWNGDDTASVSPGIRAHELDAFVGLGFVVWEWSIELGVLVGDRSLVPTRVSLADKNMLRHAFSLLHASTDAIYISSLDPPIRNVYASTLVRRAELVRQVALDYLIASTTCGSRTLRNREDALVLEASRETAFLVAVLAPWSMILLLSDPSPTSFLDPSISTFSSTPMEMSGPRRSATLRAVHEILDVVSATPTLDRSMNLANRPRRPAWGATIVSAARGILLELENDPNDAFVVSDGLELCEVVLAHQATKWPVADRSLVELAILRGEARNARADTSLCARSPLSLFPSLPDF
ncbi:hypothetical protein JCM10212_006537 [Sporobolomyces blumeae]